MDLRDADGMTVEGATYNDYTWDHSHSYDLHAARAGSSSSR